MKKIFYLLLFLSNLVIAQTTPSFQSRFFFEDAVGNKDTLYWGTDLSATSENDPELGEVFINEPFDSVFEVRAITEPYSFYYTANPIIVPATDLLPPQFDCDIAGGGFYILMSLKYPPVTVSWEDADFYDVCHLRSFLTPIEHNLVDTPNDDYWSCVPSICLSESNSFQFDFFPESYGCVNAEDIGIYRIEELNNGVVDTLKGVIFENNGFESNWGPCTHLILSELENLSANTKIEIYPNPTSNSIKIISDNNIDWERVEVFTSQGEKKSSQLIQGSEVSYSFENYPSGVYFLKFFNSKSQLIATKKVVRM